MYILVVLQSYLTGLNQGSKLARLDHLCEERQAASNALLYSY